MTKFFRKAVLFALLCSLSNPVLGPAKAQAGVLFMTTGSVIGFALGFGMIIGGSARRIIPLIVLDHAPDSKDISIALQIRYPELDTALSDELALIISAKLQTVTEDHGIKEVSLDETELRPILNVLQWTQAELAQKMVQDFK